MQALAVPTLLFDNGNLSFTNTSVEPATGDLVVNANIVGSEGLDPAVTAGTLTLTASLSSVNPGSTSTQGLFSGVDLTLKDTGGGTLLLAKSDSLLLEGTNGLSSGALSGMFSATGGALAGLFGTGDLFSFVLNLDTIFSDVMFDSNFYGTKVSGRITAVPEPGVLGMLALGLVVMGLIRQRRNAQIG